MERLHRIDFSQSQQQFHIDDDAHPKNNPGWITIIINCSDLEYELFMIFIDVAGKEKLTNSFVRKTAKYCEKIIRKLNNNKLQITRV